MPTSRTSRQKIVAVNERWLRCTSSRSRSASRVRRVCDDCVCQASLNLSGLVIRLVSHQFAQSFFRTIQLHSHVAIGDAQHLGHLPIAQRSEERRVGKGSTFVLYT